MERFAILLLCIFPMPPTTRSSCGRGGYAVLRLHSLPILLLALLILLGARPLLALEAPALRGRVNDFAHMLSPTTVRQLDRSLATFAGRQSTPLMVVTTPTLAGDKLKALFVRSKQSKKTGLKGLDNGAILLVVRGDREIRIQVGNKLQARLTDRVCEGIIRNVITPYFRSGNFDQGIIAGVSAMMDAVRGDYSTAKLVKSDPTASGVDLHGFLVILLLGIFFTGKAFGRRKVLAATAGGLLASLLGILFFGFNPILIVALLAIGMVGGLITSVFATSLFSGTRPGGRGRFWMSEGGFSGGGFGGSGFRGGGGFGGGGASGGW